MDLKEANPLKGKAWKTQVGLAIHLNLMVLLKILQWKKV